jgi:hypothetical protein
MRHHLDMVGFDSPAITVAALVLAIGFLACAFTTAARIHRTPPSSKRH